MSNQHQSLDGALNPPTPDRPMGGPDSRNQPPPPPPESDPKQEYGEDHMGIPRPQSNDANRPADDRLSDEVPDDPAAHGVRADSLDAI